MASIPEAVAPGASAARRTWLARALFERDRLFWVLQIGGWGGYTFAAWLGALAHEKPDSYIHVILATAGSGLIITSGLRYLYQAIWTRTPTVIATTSIASCYLLALGWRVATNLVYWEVVKHGYRPEYMHDYFSGAIGSFYVLVCWSGLYFGVKYYQQLQHQTEKALKATAAAHQAQLKMLRYQLNPHFLFNTLNAISTLILDGRNDVANNAVTRLSEFLRYTLDNDPMKRVPLQRELNALSLYLNIEQLRFADRLRLQFDVSTEVEAALVPSLILQPLVENAIKYAVAPREEGGRIRFAAKRQDDRLRMRLEDDGPGIDATNGNGNGNGGCGVGLRNTRDRLEQLYGPRHDLHIGRSASGGVAIEIVVPFELRTEPA